ncbi:MAG: non-homologous end-joining DNA ligase [Archangiaceae bacterium]|nr:non-homologous end-joining DNA ligase [Archangiaceae bacterium]
MTRRETSRRRSAKKRPATRRGRRLGRVAPPRTPSSDAAHQKLAEYRKKRDFQVTPEPAGGAPSQTGYSFVVQKHHASHLHYDFRLELDGVLLSWAVPKGVSVRANEKRFAARTEDHPLDYGDFEGIIPKGEYGGGTVMLWDHGTWEPFAGDGDPRETLKKGKLVFDLHGEKLKGRFHMVRTKTVSGKEQWLIFKGKDADARDEDITLQDRSVTTGRSLDEIAAGRDRIWHSNKEGPSITELVKQIPTQVKLTNLDKVMYPENGLTKAALIAYAATLADRLLVHVADRPMALLRCPDGREKCFFQKHGTVPLPKQVHQGEDWVSVADAEGLIALAQSGVLELHTWGCHRQKIEQPDQLVIDFDPDTALEWRAVVQAAVELRERLTALKLESFVKTTGGKGLHVVVPFAPSPKLQWDAFKAFARGLAEAVEADDPTRYTTNIRKNARGGKIFVDYLRNGRGATAVAAYSTRAREGATVSCPVTWEELPRVKPSDFTVLTVPSRKGDPWEGWAEALKQKLPKKPS